VKARRVTEITIQTDEAFVVRRSKDSVATMCSQCAVAGPMVTPDEAAAVFRIPVRLIYRAIEAGQLHFQEASTGPVMVCLESLRKVVPLLTRISRSQIKNNKEIES